MLNELIKTVEESNVSQANKELVITALRQGYQVGFEEGMKAQAKTLSAIADLVPDYSYTLKKLG